MLAVLSGLRTPVPPELARLRLKPWSVHRDVAACSPSRPSSVPPPSYSEVTQARVQIGASSLLKPGSRQSPGKGPRGGALKLLAVLAIVQLVALGHRTPRPETPTPEFAVGDDLSSLVIKDSGGETIDLGAGSKTLLLVFDPDCPHTTRVAKDWASWLAQARPEAHRTIAVSSGALSTAVRYAQDKHWEVQVGAVEPAADGKGDHSLTKRTPWVFAVGPDGTVVAEGHGIRLAEVAQTIRRS